VILAAGPGGGRALLGGLALAALIVLYDVSHNKNPLGPLVMGLCRVAAYATAALAASSKALPGAPLFAPPVFAGMAFLLLYLITLSLLAREETTNPKIPRLVGLMIAGICLIDGAQLAVMGELWAAALAVVAFVLTRLWQRRIPGT
jgi:hypothetical protein